MKFSRHTFYLIVLLTGVLSGGVSCSMLSLSSSESDEFALEEKVGDLAEDAGAEDDAEDDGELEGLDDQEGEGAGEDWADTDNEEDAEGNSEGELADFEDEFADFDEDANSEEDSETSEGLDDGDIASSDVELDSDFEEGSDLAQEGVGQGDEELDEEEFAGEESLEEEWAEDDGQEVAGVEEDISDSEDFAEEPVDQDVGGGGDDFLAEEGQEEYADAGDAASESGLGITNIQFLADQGGGTVAITGDGEMEYETRFNKSTNQYTVDIFNAFLPESLRRPFIMKDFSSSPFGAINAYQEDGDSKVSVVVQLKDSSVSPSVQKEGNMIYVLSSGDGGGTLLADNDSEEGESGEVFEESVGEDIGGNGDIGGDSEVPTVGGNSSSSRGQPLGVRSLEEFLVNNNKFYGKKISMNLQGVPIIDAINFIMAESGANLVVSQEVKGEVTMNLREVPWDQVLVILLRTHKLGYVRQGNVIRIASISQLQEEAATSKSIIESQRSLQPVLVRVIPVSYAKVENLSGQVSPFLTPNRGKVAVDARTNSVIITDTKEVLARVSALIKQLDTPPEQVMIEGKVVEATEAFSKSLGVSWGLSGAQTNLGSGASGPLTITPSLGIRPVADTVSGTAVMNLNIGTLDFLGDLDAALALAESDSVARVISSPRIVTLNKQASEISQSGEILSLSAVNNNGVTTTQVNRTPVTLSLKVTPQITSSGGIIMDVDVTRQFPGALEDLTSLARSVNSRSAKTKVLVQHGQTAVIGGIYSTREGDSEVGVPFFKDIPFFGWLFKSRSHEKDKNELLLFLTPRIMGQKL